VLTQMDLNDIQKTKAQLVECVWVFKHGDNILFNFEILRALYEGSIPFTRSPEAQSS
jgi:hypothetical protein